MPGSTMLARLLCAALTLFAVPALADDELAAVDRAAPKFRLPVYNSKAVGSAMLGLTDYVGQEATDKKSKAVLLSFMASFCAPCKKEMPYLQSLHEKYGPQGLRVMMVSIDTEDKGFAIINELIGQNKVTFPVLKDRFNIVARRWLGSKSPLPSVFLVNSEGVVTMVHRGYDQEASALLDKEVSAAVAAGK